MLDKKKINFIKNTDDKCEYLDYSKKYSQQWMILKQPKYFLRVIVSCFFLFVGLTIVKLCHPNGNSCNERIML